MSKLGLGDLCILAERELYRSRVTGVEVRIWTWTPSSRPARERRVRQRVPYPT
ncbi:hypothetical protein [Nonomuraea longispora]|uniref:hypothetical protein n=1 Tax=Nonomuraea longispora TaxID=1848320 RepID=UPI0015F2C39A|nr:hypothetical protein [Nonomuraea longispora]